MNEVKESLRSIEQKYKLFQQQQFTFIAALEHCRENAHDKIRPISSVGQVRPGKQGAGAGWGRMFFPARSPYPKHERWSPREENCMLLSMPTQILMDGNCPSVSTTYPIWLKTQPAWL